MSKKSGFDTKPLTFVPILCGKFSRMRSRRVAVCRCAGPAIRGFAFASVRKVANVARRNSVFASVVRDLESPWRVPPEAQAPSWRPPNIPLPPRSDLLWTWTSALGGRGAKVGGRTWNQFEFVASVVRFSAGF